MKILWVSHLVPYPPKAGVLERAYHLVKELSRHHEIHLLCLIQKSLLAPYYPTVDGGLEEARRALGAFCASVEFYDIPKENRKLGKPRLAVESLFRLHPYTLNWLKSPEFSQALSKALDTVDFDVVHFDTISLAPFVELCAGVPYVFDHHNIESHMLLRRAHNETQPLKKAYFFQEGIRLRHYERRYCQQASLNITCSQVDARHLRGLSPAIKTAVIPNGVDVGYFSPDRPHKGGSPRLLFLGTLDWYPNRRAVEFIAEQIWPLLKERIPEVRIDIIGANPPQQILALSRSDPDFVVHGFVDDIRSYLNNAAAFLCPIADGGGTKLKILDALAMELPIVSHPLACEGINVTDGIDVLFAQRAPEYVEAITRLLNNPAMAASLGKAGRQLIQTQYDFRQIGKKLSMAYTEISNSSDKSAPCVASQA